MSSRQQVAQDVVAQLVKLMESGNLPPWKHGWSAGGYTIPVNATTDKPYRGINTWVLWSSAMLNYFDDPRWLTRKQAERKGGEVPEDETGTVIVFWNIWKKRISGKKGDDDDENFRNIPFLRKFLVYNVEQTVGCGFPLIKLEKYANDPIVEAENVVQKMPNPPKIIQRAHTPAYSDTKDTVFIPPMAAWHQVERYYSTLFHELVHSTAHKSRIGRKLDPGNTDSVAYSQEELIAEMGASMLCAVCGIILPVIEVNAAYLKHYIDFAKGNPEMIIRASQQAQKSMDYILGSNQI